MMLRILVTLALLVMTEAFFIDDTCDLLPQGPKHAGNTMDVVVPGECKNGTMAWHYPQGTINLHFATHRVCFSNSQGGEIFKISDISNGHVLHLPRLVRGSADEVCTERHKNKVQLQIVAPHTLYIMGTIDYMTKVPIHTL